MEVERKAGVTVHERIRWHAGILCFLNERLWWPDIRAAFIATLSLRLATSLFAALVAFLLHDTYRRDFILMSLDRTDAAGRLAHAATTGLAQYISGPWLRWDANLYLDIAAQGYISGSGNTAFLPLYPLLIHLASAIFGGNLVVAALAVSTCASFAMFLLLYRLAQRLTGSPAIAAWTVTVAALLPIAFFFMAPYTEALFLALALATILAVLDGRWWRAALLAALAALIRPQGLVLGVLALPALARGIGSVWEHNHPLMLQWRATWRLIYRPLAMAVAPVVTYGTWNLLVMLALHQLASWQAMTSPSAWNEHLTVPGAGILVDLRLIWSYPDAVLFHYLGIPLDVVAAVIGLVLLVLAWKRMPPEIIWYLVACWCTAVCKVTPDGATQSAARYLLALVPLCIVPAGWLSRSRSGSRVAVVAVCAYLWCFYLGEWVLWSWVS